MGLFDRKTEAEKQRKADIKDIKKDAREDKRDARKDAREDKKDARQDARDAKHDARADARQDKQDARQDKREDLKDIRQSDLKGEAKRDAKSEARDDKRDDIRTARDEKKVAVHVARDGKKTAIDTIQNIKRDAIDDITKREFDALAGLALRDTSVLDAALALELLALTHAAQHQDIESLGANDIVQSTISGSWASCMLNGATVRNGTGIAGRTFKSDIECFVARSDGDEVVVAFRGSETAFFDRVGAFKDWVLTDFRANRIAYPPAPRSWPDQRWVHAGFWQSYNQIRNVLLSEVTARAVTPRRAKRIYVTGFSLGGALALLAALDIAEGVRDVPVELFTFAAPRAGDANLNSLLKQRVAKSTLVAFRGDPVVHLPPFGANFPITLKNPISLDLAGIHIGLGTPLPQVGQQYRTADDLVYIDENAEVKDKFPLAQVALRFTDHDWPPYCAALLGIARQQAMATATAG